MIEIRVQFSQCHMYIYVEICVVIFWLIMDIDRGPIIEINSIMSLFLLINLSLDFKHV